jgi:hypothetical protein
MQHLIDRQVERTNRNLIIANAAILLVLAGAAFASSHYLLNYVAGPFPSSLDQLAKGSDAPERDFVALEGTPERTGYDYVSTQIQKGTHREVKREITATYLTLRQGSRVILVKAPASGLAGPRAIGRLRRPEKIDRQVMAQLPKDDPDRAAGMMPLVLDATGFRTPGTIGLVIGGILALLALRNLRNGLARRVRPTTHPIWARLARLGDARSLALEIDEETRASDALALSGGVTLTGSWLLRRTVFDLTVLRVERLVWFHKKVTTQRQAFITVGKFFEAVLHDRDGATVSLRAKEADVDRLLGELAVRAPWVIVGWSADLEKAWRKRRREMIAAVDARRQQASRSGGPGASA